MIFANFLTKLKGMCFHKRSQDLRSHQMLHKLAVVSILKNEARYIKEWLDYHRLVGVDHFYLYDNESSDNVFEILEPYINQGIVSYDFIAGRGKQLEVYNAALLKHRDDSELLAFIDIDEFMVPLSAPYDLYKQFSEILAIDKNAAGVSVNWRMFGSSGFDRKPSTGCVIDNFLWRAKDDGLGNNCVKAVVKPNFCESFPNPHYPKLIPGKYMISEKGTPVKEWQNIDLTLNKVRINHYFTKSKEEWTERRSLGAADSGKLNRTIEDFYLYDNNDMYDDKILNIVRELSK